MLTITHRRKRRKNAPDLYQERSQEDLSPFKMQFGYLLILCVFMSFVAATPLPYGYLQGGGNCKPDAVIGRAVKRVNAPGACVLDGTPRDCVVNACGAQADTGIIRDDEIDRGK
ncbi:hypothetical protein BGZ88_005356 [Linnemannia elongata]|nr:hypothetical protein BGZ88_005356 [Linnemannia elongata]